MAVTGNIDRDPAGVLASLLTDLGVLIEDETGRVGPIQDCTDSGVENGGDGGGNLVLVTAVSRHGLSPGEHVTLTGTGYDGDREVEPASDFAFYLLNVAFVGETAGGSWS